MALGDRKVRTLMRFLERIRKLAVHVRDDAVVVVLDHPVVDGLG